VEVLTHLYACRIVTTSAKQYREAGEKEQSMILVNVNDKQIKITDIETEELEFQKNIVKFKLECEGNTFESCEYLNKEDGKNVLEKSKDSNVYNYSMEESAEFFNQEINNSSEMRCFFIDDEGSTSYLPDGLLKVYEVIESEINK